MLRGKMSTGTWTFQLFSMNYSAPDLQLDNCVCRRKARLALLGGRALHGHACQGTTRAVQRSA